MIENTPLCYGRVARDSDPWFSDDEYDQALARGICKVCPVWATCMVHALINDFAYGIFAGLDPAERKPIREKMFKELPAETIAALTDKYFMPDIMEDRPVRGDREAKYRRRRDRAEVCYERLMIIDPETVGPQYGAYLDCVEAVLNNPDGTGDVLGRAVGKSGSLFNQRLRECFEYFDMDMSVL